MIAGKEAYKKGINKSKFEPVKDAGVIQGRGRRGARDGKATVPLSCLVRLE